MILLTLIHSIPGENLANSLIGHNYLEHNFNAGRLSVKVIIIDIKNTRETRSYEVAL